VWSSIAPRTEPTARARTLPHAGASPSNLAASAQWIAVLDSAEDRVAKAFAHSRGVPYAAYRRFHEVMAVGGDLQNAVSS
jgi:hypothetical protein